MNITETMQAHTPSSVNSGVFCAGCTQGDGPYVMWPCNPILDLRIGAGYEARLQAARLRELADRYENEDGHDGFADYIDGLRHAANVLDPEVDESMDDRE
jgi:hypothetical protein